MQLKASDSCPPVRKRKHDEVDPLDVSEVSKKSKTESASKSIEEPTTPTSKGRRASSIYRGVCWLKERKAWRARIEIAGKREHLGYFTSEKEAAMAYDRRARTVARKKSRLNFPEFNASEGETSQIRGGGASSVHIQTAEDPKKSASELLSISESKVAEAKASLLSLGLSQSCGQLNPLGVVSPFGSVLNLQQQINFMQLQYNLVNSLNAQSGSMELGSVKAGLQPVCGSPSAMTYPLKSFQAPVVNCTSAQRLNPALFSLV